MNWIKKVFGVGNRPEQDAPERNAPTVEGRIHIAEPNPLFTAAPGQEMAQFLKEISVVVGEQVTSEDLDKNLISDFGLDELDISECLIVGEEAWGALTPRSAMTQNQLDQHTNRFQTLRDIINYVQRQRG